MRQTGEIKRSIFLLAIRESFIRRESKSSLFYLAEKILYLSFIIQNITNFHVRPSYDKICQYAEMGRMKTSK